MPDSPPNKKLSRRALLRAGAVGLGGLGTLDPFSAAALAAQQALPAQSGEPKAFNHFPRMVQEYFVARVQEIEKLADKRRAALQSKADAQAYVREARRKTRECFGAWPQKTPLNARVTGTLDRGDYKVEKVIFESRPDFPVTANLYLPPRPVHAAPGVVCPCGHTASGKAADEYQSIGQTLARQGYLVLVYDPIGQGERYQYVDAQLKPIHGGGTSEHLYAGNQQFLVGEFFGSWRAWDGIRALDYLLTRTEIDPARVAVSGVSGGGTMTTWLAAVEHRWCAAAPCCFVTTFRRNLENELPADTEQCPPHALALGLDHSDFIAAFAPKPVILLDEERDFFDIRGVEEAFGRLRALYKLLGAEDNVQMSAGPGYHGYGKEDREAMYGWLNRITKVSGSSTEPQITIEKEETLWCTPHGQVAEFHPRTVFSFTREISQSLARQRKPLNAAQLKTELPGALKIEPASRAPDYRILRPSNGRQYPKKYAATYAVETEPGAFALVYRLSDTPLESRIPRGPSRAILYVSHRSADDELRTEPTIADVMQSEPDSAVFACDVRGIGESQPNTCGSKDFAEPYGSDYFYAIHSIMLDRPYVGQKTYDLLRLIALLKATGHVQVHVLGKGWGSLPATFASLLSDDVVQVTLKNAPIGYSAIAASESYNWPLSSFIPGVLKTFDLPDCYAALASKKLRQIDPWNAESVTSSSASA
ncbi:MAG TPA: acetylxylan esterase [Candidatus Aquilonibacter sp.]|nr:acetylxylan esterase [Candidatus Aquilonibacter sp.]